MIASGRVAIDCVESGVVEVSKCCSNVMAGEAGVSSSRVVFGWEFIDKACSEGSSFKIVGHVLVVLFGKQSGCTVLNDDCEVLSGWQKWQSGKVVCDLSLQCNKHQQDQGLTFDLLWLCSSSLLCL